MYSMPLNYTYNANFMLYIFYHNNFFLEVDSWDPEATGCGHGRDNGLQQWMPTHKAGQKTSPNSCGSRGPVLRLAEKHFRMPEKTPNIAAGPEGHRLCPHPAAPMLKGYTSFFLHLTPSRGGEGTEGPL